MISVFAAFMLIDLPFIKTMGFALAVGVFMDAFFVRMMIIPATMFLLDKVEEKSKGKEAARV